MRSAFVTCGHNEAIHVRMRPGGAEAVERRRFRRDAGVWTRAPDWGRCPFSRGNSKRMYTKTDVQTKVSRRSVVRGMAWSVPVLALATAAPAQALSGCTTFTTSLTSSSAVQNPMMLAASDGTSSLSVRVSSVLGANTTVSQNGQTFNMTRSGSGWRGGFAGDGSRDSVFSNFGPAGAIILNQRSTASSSNLPLGSPTQTLTFTVLDGATPLAVQNLRLTVFDISSASGQAGGWRGVYWDAVGFGITPTDISSAAGKDQGAGTGSIGDPFRRSSGSLATGTGPYSDTFTFASVPSSGLQMRYSSYQSRSGWQFISIAGITFDVC